MSDPVLNGILCTIAVMLWFAMNEIGRIANALEKRNEHERSDWTERIARGEHRETEGGDEG